MLTGDIRNRIDRIWDAFWSGGIANPVEVIEQQRIAAVLDYKPSDVKLSPNSTP